MSSVNDNLFLKKKYITEFHDTIAMHPTILSRRNISYIVLYSRKSKTKLIPGWDAEMNSSRDKSKFWHRIWSECGREHTGIVYDIMKKARSKYHYLLRALKKKKHCKTKISISKCCVWTIILLYTCITTINHCLCIDESLLLFPLLHATIDECSTCL